MRLPSLRIGLVGLVMALMPGQVACRDTGDDVGPPLPGDDSADASTSDSSADDGTTDVAAAEAGIGNGVTSANDAAATPDASADASASAPDAALVDAGPLDAILHDAAAPDATLDAATLDTNAEDSGTVDSTVGGDGETADASTADTGAVGTLPDGGSFDDLCQTYNLDAGCTATELLFLEHDPSGDCYTCLVNNGALDDNVYPDVGHECSDVVGNAAAGAQAGVPREELCLSTLSCILGLPETTTCATEGQPTFCYCGAGVGPAACSALSGTPNGACTQQEADGLELPVAPTIPVLKAFPNQALGSGQANSIINAAAANGCNTCF